MGLQLVVATAHLVSLSRIGEIPHPARRSRVRLTSK